MSKEAALAFRVRVLGSAELQKAFRAATDGGNRWDWPAVVALGHRSGLDFTAEEAQATLNEIDQNELSDFELEFVGGGKSGSDSKSSKWTEKLVGVASSRSTDAANKSHQAQ